MGIGGHFTNVPMGSGTFPTPGGGAGLSNMGQVTNTNVKDLNKMTVSRSSNLKRSRADSGGSVCLDMKKQKCDDTISLGEGENYELPIRTKDAVGGDDELGYSSSDSSRSSKRKRDMDESVEQLSVQMKKMKCDESQSIAPSSKKSKRSWVSLNKDACWDTRSGLLYGPVKQLGIDSLRGRANPFSMSEAEYAELRNFNSWGGWHGGLRK